MVISNQVAVLLVMAYVDQFDFPLSVAEIQQRLIKIVLSRAEVELALVSLQKKGLVEHQNQWWRLSTGQAQAQTRRHRQQLAQTKWLEVERLVKVVGWIPWIRGVAVTGSLAVSNVSAQSDIDLMLVASARRLWLSRLLVLVSVWWVGKRRTWQGKRVDGWCFNLWLDESNLGLQGKKRNIYSAYEICQVKWVLDKGGVEARFWQQNVWVKKLLPNFYREMPQALVIKNKFGLWWDVLNWWAFKIQYWHMYAHMSREVVTLDMAYFHPRPTQCLIYHHWLSALKKTSRVLVTGVFDLFHVEHRRFLLKAKQAGDVLIVGVESDARVKKIKGIGRPVQNEQTRLSQLQQFAAVDMAFVLPERFNTPRDHLALLKLVKPQVLAVSSHTPHLAEKRRLMKQVGGKVVVVHTHNLAVSTSLIVEGQK